MKRILRDRSERKAEAKYSEAVDHALKAGSVAEEWLADQLGRLNQSQMNDLIEALSEGEAELLLDFPSSQVAVLVDNGAILKWLFEAELLSAFEAQRGKHLIEAARLAVEATRDVIPPLPG